VSSAQVFAADPHGHALSDAERRAYREDGFFVRPGVFDQAELAVLRKAAERVAERSALRSAGGDAYAIDGNRYVDFDSSTLQFEHTSDTKTIRVIEPFHMLDPVFDALVDDPRLTEPMCGLTESKGVALWTDKINLKRPREGSSFRWHQDSPYWTHACSHVDLLPNVMVALDDADEGNGCFRVIRGSHKRGCLPGIEDETTLGVLFTDPAAFDESRQVAAEVEAGGLVFFSPHTVHGSQPNTSTRPRRAMVLTYQPADFAMFKLEGVRNAGPAAAR
jgi:ectoine hydroxylase-related dioxygenase (phytanoyl-CoA dioxygenase family)